MVNGNPSQLKKIDDFTISVDYDVIGKTMIKQYYTAKL